MRVLGGWLNALISLGSFPLGAGFGGDGDRVGCPGTEVF
jgi:hypothetical protein